MSWPTRAALVVAGAAALAATILYLMWREAAVKTAECRVEYNTLLQQWQTEANKVSELQKEKGELIMTRDQWRMRAESTPQVIIDETPVEVVKHVVKRIPVNCQRCIENYELDRSYVNPEKETIPAETIKIDITDILGRNEAEWSIDVPRLCPIPICPPSLNPQPIPCPEDETQAIMLLETGLGYGVAGPELSAGLYPLVMQSDKWDLEFGGWGNLTLHDTGVMSGNAVLGVKARRKGGW